MNEWMDGRAMDDGYIEGRLGRWAEGQKRKSVKQTDRQTVGRQTDRQTD